MSRVAEEPQVVKANALVEASYRLSLYEQRILLSCISQIQRNGEVTDEILYKVSAADIANRSGVDMNTVYRELKAASERLFDRRVTLHQGPNGVKKPHKRLTRWIQTVDYIEGEGRIEVRFAKDILPYLSKITEQFTKYALEDISRMSSTHAIRIYEMLMQWEDKRIRTVEIGWLRQALELEDSYPSIKDFKKWVIEPAVKQINEQTKLTVSWDQKKTGRKVTHFVFTFHNKQATLPEADSKKPEKRPQHNPGQGIWHGYTKAELEKRANPGESYEQVARRLQEEARKSA